MQDRKGDYKSGISKTEEDQTHKRMGKRGETEGDAGEAWSGDAHAGEVVSYYIEDGQ